jgi:tetraacyldisaccharide 4'-kinase
MRAAPLFWGASPGVASALLEPAAAAWDAVGRLRRALARPYRAPVAVVCVGNLVVGGAGKTPVAMALADHLIGRGPGVHIVSRGYGGSGVGPVRVDPARHDAAAVGDEALLLARHAPAWVARDRVAGVAAAAAAGADIVLLDDGFQNPRIAKDLSLIVIDAAYGFGNGRVIPAGPLRESRRRGLARADAAVILGGDAGMETIRRALPVVPAVLAPIAGERLAGTRVAAFAGIGRPEKFFATLRALEAELVAARAYPDHYRYRPADLDELRRAADRAGAQLVTTAKDILRVPPAARLGIEVLEIEIRWLDPEALARLCAPIVRCPNRDGRAPDHRP